MVVGRGGCTEEGNCGRTMGCAPEGVLNPDIAGLPGEDAKISSVLI